MSVASMVSSKGRGAPGPNSYEDRAMAKLGPSVGSSTRSLFALESP